MELLSDVTMHIVSRLSDREMGALASVSQLLKGMIEELPQLFWYERTISLLREPYLLPRQGADWRRIYSDLTSKEEGFVGGASNLDTMKVLFEVSDETSISHGELIYVRNEDVLEYLLDSGAISADSDSESGTTRYDEITLGVLEEVVADTMKEHPNNALAMIRMLRRKNIDVGTGALKAALLNSRIDVYEELLQDGVTSLEDEVAQRAAVRSGNVSTLKYVLGVTDSSDVLKLTELAANYGQISVVKYLLSLRKLSTSGLKVLYLKRLQVNPKITQAFLDAGLSLEQSDWVDLAEEYIERDYPKSLRLALKHFDPRSENNSLLMLAMRSYPGSTLEVLLDDPRVDPTLNLRDVLLDSDKELVIKLVKHPRIVMSALSLADRSSLYNLLLSARGLQYSLKDLVSPPDAYWNLVGYLVAKQPTAEEILEYIKANLLGAEEVRQALASVLDSRKAYSDKAAPIRALLLYLIYPDMTKRESEYYLRRHDKYSPDLVTKSDMLISLVLR